jgi:hypothetical protein
VFGAGREIRNGLAVLGGARCRCHCIGGARRGEHGLGTDKKMTRVYGET